MGVNFLGANQKGAGLIGRERSGATDWARPIGRDRWNANLLGATRMGAKFIRREHLDASVWARPFGRDRLGAVPFGRRVN